MSSIAATVKRWVLQHLLIKPSEALLHRPTKDGGLGLSHIDARCQAALLRNFIVQAHPLSSHQNFYLMIIFRQFVMQETFPTEVKRPNFYTPTFFDIIKEAVQDEGLECVFTMSTKAWYIRVLHRGITASRDPETGVSTPIKSGQETLFPDANWQCGFSLPDTRLVTQTEIMDV